MNFEVEQISTRIVHLRFKKQVDMGKTMLRFQEHFESPEFRGKVFKMPQFKRWYIKRYGKFSYYTDWVGFNFPSSSLKPFYDGSFDPLSVSEAQVLAALFDTGAHYVVASAGNVTHMRHELGHAFYHLDSAYKKRVDTILSRLKGTEYPKEKIRQMMYVPEVLQDELHAYLIDGLARTNKVLGLSAVMRRDVLKDYSKASQKLNRLLDRTLAAAR